MTNIEKTKFHNYVVNNKINLESEIALFKRLKLYKNEKGIN